MTRGFLFAGLLMGCAAAPKKPTLPKEYRAAINVGCFLYALQNTIDDESRNVVAIRCATELGKAYMTTSEARGDE